MARSNASNVTPIHASAILSAGAVAPNFTLHVTPDQTLTLRWVRMKILTQGTERESDSDPR